MEFTFVESEFHTTETYDVWYGESFIGFLQVNEGDEEDCYVELGVFNPISNKSYTHIVPACLWDDHNLNNLPHFNKAVMEYLVCNV